MRRRVLGRKGRVSVEAWSCKDLAHPGLPDRQPGKWQGGLGLWARL